MLDIKLIRQNPDFVKEGLKKKGVDVSVVAQILELDEKRRIVLQEVEEMRHRQKNLGLSREEIEEAKELKSRIKEKEKILAEIEPEIENLLRKVPNLPLDDVPVGKDEKENVILREVGEKPKFDFKPKDYLEIAEKLDWIDVVRASKVSGSRFGYLKNEAALLEFALIKLVFDILIPENFIPVIPPVIIKEDMMKAMGYVDSEKDKDERYYLEKDKQYFVGTSEQSIGPMHSDEIFEEKDLPKRYVAFSTCFRREAGSYGKDTKGILRVHQFDKMEMFSFCHPEKSKEEHNFLLFMEEKIMQALKIPYRVAQLCAGDLSHPSAATYDIEAWMPGQSSIGSDRGIYRETHSTSNCTNFQARRLNVRFRDKNGKLEFVHTLNGTAIAIGRMIIAIIENYQQKDGAVKIPEHLKFFT